MSRPLKLAEDKKTQRLTIYLTELEQDTLKKVADILGRPQTSIVVDAIYGWLDLLAVDGSLDEEVLDLIDRVTRPLYKKTISNYHFDDE